MRGPFTRGALQVPADVLSRAGLTRGERVLASCAADDGTWLLGTRDAFVVVGQEGETTRIAWEQVESADWSRDDDRLRVREVGEFGRPRPSYVFTLAQPGSLLSFLRERVTASIVLQRRVVVRGRSGLAVIARRPPNGSGAISWAYELDPGLDPDDPEVRAMAEAGLRAATEELGLN